MMRQLNLNTSWALVSLMSTLAAACSGGGGNGSGATDSGRSSLVAPQGTPDELRSTEIQVVAREDQGHMTPGSVTANAPKGYASFTSATDAVFAASEDTQPVALPDAALQADADDNVNAFNTRLQ